MSACFLQLRSDIHEKTSLDAPIADLPFLKQTAISQSEHRNEHLLHHRCGGGDNGSRGFLEPARIGSSATIFEVVKGKRDELAGRLQQHYGYHLAPGEPRRRVAAKTPDPTAVARSELLAIQGCAAAWNFFQNLNRTYRAYDWTCMGAW
jgi:hypothetical protein